MPRTVQRAGPGPWQTTYTLDTDERGAEVIAGVNLALSDGGQLPNGGLNAQRLRGVRMDLAVVTRTWDDLRVSGATYADLRAAGSYANLAKFTFAKPRRGQSHDPRFLALVAARYVASLDEPDIYAAIAADLAARGLTYRRKGVQELVAKARNRGLLTGAKRGSRGGQLTPLARRLLISD
jgi:hypothetical protein